MKLLVSMVLATFAGVCIGATEVEVLKAQAEPPVYAIGEIDVRDPDGYAKEYVPLARSTIKAHGGQYLAAGSAVGIDGEPPKRLVILKWDSIDQLMPAITGGPDFGRGLFFVVLAPFHPVDRF
jgi:uncharacterized protein (DUF1330 family)